MPPNKCAQCGGSEFHSELLKVGFPFTPFVFTVNVGSILSGIYVKGAVCLKCGVVVSYVEDAALKKIRSRIASRKPKSAIP